MSSRQPDHWEENLIENSESLYSRLRTYYLSNSNLHCQYSSPWLLLPPSLFAPAIVASERQGQEASGNLADPAQPGARAVCPASRLGPARVPLDHIPLLSLTGGEGENADECDSEALSSSSEYDSSDSVPIPSIPFDHSIESDSGPEDEGDDSEYDSSDSVPIPSIPFDHSIESDSDPEDEGDDSGNDNGPYPPPPPPTPDILCQPELNDDRGPNSSDLSSELDTEQTPLLAAYWTTLCNNPDSDAEEVNYNSASPASPSVNSHVKEQSAADANSDEYEAGAEDNGEEDGNDSITGEASRTNSIDPIIRPRQMPNAGHPGPPAAIARTRTTGATTATAHPSPYMFRKRGFGTVRSTCRLLTREDFNSTGQSQHVGGSAQTPMSSGAEIMDPYLECWPQDIPHRAYRVFISLPFSPWLLLFPRISLECL
ncbi:hypothetical protein L873DRAFT_463045 [Choiromyces venosus 120613-1]|uniref:Uncharacterized protein n=1 Tax=Choiromyces venosus 120613-1 TaxID=1336337 RepID=A0A3N4JVP1_9PEZI|nr:hypothetical protein L873DRAFT_463045 [Choiromyces venosus 120613-1]